MNANLPAKGGSAEVLASIRPLIPQLARERQRVVKVATWMLVIGCLLTGALGLISLRRAKKGLHPVLILAPLLISAAVSQYPINRFRRTYKERVFTTVLRLRFPRLTYAHDQYMGAHLFAQSGLFRRSPDDYDGEDYFTGKVDDVPIAFSEIRADQRVRHGKHESRRPIFHGVFFMTEFNKNLEHYTVVVQDKWVARAGVAAAQLFGDVHTGLNLASVRLENPTFERMFEAFSTDQTEARYILSPALMERLVALAQRFGKNTPRIAFHTSRMFIAIPQDKDLFEPKVFGRVSDVEAVLSFVEEVRLFEEIVRVLKLNDYLWSKIPAKPEGAAPLPYLDIGVG